MAITTTYRGVEYRSRLEARWAAFFDRLGWQHTYEPFDGDGYIPDFIIHGGRPILIEIKPAVTLAEYHAPTGKVTRGVAAHWQHDILILGVTPLPHIWGCWGDDLPAAGLLGEFDGNGWMFDGGHWLTCGQCDTVGVFHETMTYTARPCGHYDGDRFLGWANARRLATYWAEAANDVKWRGSAA